MSPDRCFRRWRLETASWLTSGHTSGTRRRVATSCPFVIPRDPSVQFLKRVIAVGGDVVKIKDKKVYLNGQLLVEPYAEFESSTSYPVRDDFPPTPSQLENLPSAWGVHPDWKRDVPSFVRGDGLHVPPGYMFVLGDNRDNASDTRFWGFVPQANLIGKASVIYFSWDPQARRVRWDRLGKVLK